MRITKINDDHNPQITSIIEFASNNELWQFPFHRHEDVLEITVFTEGTFESTCGNKHFTVGENDCIIFSPKVYHAGRGSDFKSISAIFTGIHINDLPINNLLSTNSNPFIKGNKLLTELFRYLYEHRENQDELYEQMVNTVLLYIISLIPEPLDTNFRERRPSSTPIVEDVKTFIDQNYSQPITLTFLAQQFSVSESYLSRLFSKTYGISLKQYILSIRIGEAQKLLILRPDFSIKKIAILCGYENIQHFYLSFRKFNDLTPLEYRNKYQE